MPDMCSYRYQISHGNRHLHGERCLASSLSSTAHTWSLATMRPSWLRFHVLRAAAARWIRSVTAARVCPGPAIQAHLPIPCAQALLAKGIRELEHAAWTCMWQVDQWAAQCFHAVRQAGRAGGGGARQSAVVALSTSSVPCPKLDSRYADQGGCSFQQ